MALGVVEQPQQPNQMMGPNGQIVQQPQMTQPQPASSPSTQQTIPQPLTPSSEAKTKGKKKATKASKQSESAGTPDK